MIQDARSSRPTKRPLPDALRLALDAIQDLKGNQLVVLDLRGLNDATDFFVIASGTSDAHVRGIAESVMEKLNRRGHHTHPVEGLTGGSGWPRGMPPVWRKESMPACPRCSTTSSASGSPSSCMRHTPISSRPTPWVARAPVRAPEG